MFFSKFPRVRLGNFPTPLEHLPRYGALAGHDQLYIKRDDVISLGMGGNKVRNLEFWLGDALAQGADVILAAGGLQSNQCRLAAAAAAKLGLECILLHNGDRPDFYQGNMLLNHLTGAKSVFLGPADEEERARKTQEMAEKLRREGRQPYIVGEPSRGTLGYANAAFELHSQADLMGIDLRHVVIVGAMAATATGFLYGTAVLGHPFHVHVISVEYPKDHLRGLIEKIWAGTAGLTGFVPSASPDTVATLYDEYLGEGYAVPTEGSLQAVYDLAGTEGIFLENVYTSKTVWATRELIQNGTIPATEAVCVFHTGGGPSLFAQAELFQPRS
ncbi:MAG: pyridoxal-phosphate dependent enzyme [bacterium]